MDGCMDGKPVAELRSVTCHMRSRVPCRNLSHTDRCSICVLWRNEQLSLPWCWLYMYLDDLPVCSHLYPSINHLIATRPGVEPTTSRLQVRHPTVTQPSHYCSMMLFYYAAVLIYRITDLAFSSVRPSVSCGLVTKAKKTKLVRTFSTPGVIGLLVAV